MQSKTKWAISAVVSCAILATAPMLASDLAFQLNYHLNAPASVGGVGFGRNTLALPYVRQPGLNDARDLMMDITQLPLPGPTGPYAVQSVAKFNETNDAFFVYTGRQSSPTPTPFPLAAGEGYFVKMNSNVNYLVVGSHDPSLILQLDGPGPGSNSGKNLVALPYSATSMNALQLMQDIGGGSIAPVVSVSRFDTASETFSVYTGRMGSPALVPFALQRGEA